MPALPEWAITILLVCAAMGVLWAYKPMHASLWFLLTLVVLAAAYLDLSAGFIASMQILVYAGAILVIFVFVVVLFQDAYLRLSSHRAQTSSLLLTCAAAAFAGVSLWLATIIIHRAPTAPPLPAGYGTVQALGTTLYADFFFPFEVVVLLFLAAIVGALYIAKRGA